MLGSLARLQLVWALWLILTIIQGAVLLFGGLLIQQANIGTLAAVLTLIRPWQDILFTALWGITISTWTKSVTVALAGTFAGLLAMKVLSSLSWAIAIWVNPSEQMLLFLPALGPVVLYGLAIVILLAVLPGRAATL